MCAKQAQPRVMHFQGAIIPTEEVAISPFDRGFLFGDGVYEGLRAFGGRVVGLDAHIRRMREGLAEARITGFDPASLGPLTQELLAAEGLVDAFIYWQATRGVPTPDAPPRQRGAGVLAALAPTILGFAMPTPPLEACAEPDLKTVSLQPDLRWLRGRLKSISLLGGVLAGLDAASAGADDAILVRDGLVAEAQSANLFIAKNGEVVTPSLDSAPILAGVTRGLLLAADPSIVERAIHTRELERADEIILVGTTTMVTAVTHVDGSPVAGVCNGEPGVVARNLLRTLVGAICKDIQLPTPACCRTATGAR